MRRRLVDAGLVPHADALIALGKPSIRLRSRPPALRYPQAAIVPGLERGVVAVDTNGFHHLALFADGSVAGWGRDVGGFYSTERPRDSDRPVPIAGVRGAVAVSTGFAWNMALLANGSVVGWGSNRFGEFGSHSGPGWRDPAPVPGLEHDVVAVWAGTPTFAITRDGRSWKLGGTLGEVNQGLVPDVPVPIQTPAPVRRFAEGGGGLAVLADGSLVGWSESSVGTGPAQAVGGLANVVRALGSPAVGFALLGDGAVMTWGDNWCGQLGNGTTTASPTPTAVTGLDRDVVDIAGSGAARFALKRDGSVWAWGSGDEGRLGRGTSDNALEPLPVPGLTSGVTAIAGCLALKEDGSVWAWGGDPLPDDPGADADLPVGATKLGGRPDVPDGFLWPAQDARPLTFFAQIDLGSVARFDAQGALPASGLLSFFHLDASEPSGDAASAVFRFGAGTPLVRSEFPDALPEEHRERAVALVPEADFTVHPWPPAFLNEGEAEAYHFDVMPDDEEFHRMLGYPDLIQDTPDPDGDILLLQLDFYDRRSYPEGAGRLYFLIAEDDLTARRFEQARSEYECD